MDCPRKDLFAGAAFTGNQNSRIGLSRFLGFVLYCFDGQTLADNIIEIYSGNTSRLRKFRIISRPKTGDNSLDYIINQHWPCIDKIVVMLAVMPNTDFTINKAGTAY
ncbi:hypothetical protein SDC9_197495 [bioreactor metagenome]|uniref:Uncharacterized protein n=1 Tax=bioreactor metagenome TaxID=1076179 RepID=A0A645IEX9_9ZZZZ